MVISMAKIVNLHTVIFTIITVRHNFPITVHPSQLSGEEEKYSGEKIRFDYDTERVQGGK